MPNADAQDEELHQAVERLFFAYRDFTGEADEILADYGFGRAHHRAIYFIGRNPEISVSNLLGILKITKQSLSPVLGQLVEERYVHQEPGQKDRRRRMLSLTEKGHQLEARLTRCQCRRIAAAYEQSGATAVDGFLTVLCQIIDAPDRDCASLLRKDSFDVGASRQ